MILVFGFTSAQSEEEIQNLLNKKVVQRSSLFLENFSSDSSFDEKTSMNLEEAISRVNNYLDSYVSDILMPYESGEYESSFYQENGNLSIGNLIMSINTISKLDLDSFKDYLVNIVPAIYSKYSDKFQYDNKFVLDISPAEINFDLQVSSSSNPRIIAEAESPNQGDITIIIYVDKWEELNGYQRMWLLLHEFCHEAFGMKHDGSISLMYPLMPNEELLKDQRYFQRNPDALPKSNLSGEAIIARMNLDMYKGNFKGDIDKGGFLLLKSITELFDKIVNQTIKSEVKFQSKEVYPYRNATFHGAYPWLYYYKEQLYSWN